MPAICRCGQALLVSVWPSVNQEINLFNYFTVKNRLITSKCGTRVLWHHAKLTVKARWRLDLMSKVSFHCFYGIGWMILLAERQLWGPNGFSRPPLPARAYTNEFHWAKINLQVSSLQCWWCYFCSCNWSIHHHPAFVSRHFSAQA